jgi:hypothetical protein
LTSSKMRFSAVFLLLRNESVALSLTGPPAEVDERARMSNCSSSWQAISKCSKLMRIWTIWPRYWELRRSTNDLQTFSVRSSSSDYRRCKHWASGEKGGVVPFWAFHQWHWDVGSGHPKRSRTDSGSSGYLYNIKDTSVRREVRMGTCFVSRSWFQSGWENLRELIRWLLLSEPTDIDNLFVLFWCIDGHWHVVIRRHYLVACQQMATIGFVQHSPPGSLR